MSFSKYWQKLPRVKQKRKMGFHNPKICLHALSKTKFKYCKGAMGEKALKGKTMYDIWETEG